MNPHSASSNPVHASTLSRRRCIAVLSGGLAGLLTYAPRLSAQDGKVATGLLLVTNKGDRTLSLVDPATNRQIVALPEDGVTGHEVAASLDGKRAFVPIFGDSGVGKAGTDGQLVRVFDLARRELVGTVDLGKGLRPHCAVVCQKTGLLYVTTEVENSVTVIDPEKLAILGSIPTGKEQSHMLAVTRDGQRGYTANVASGTVSVLDLPGRKLVKVIPVGRMVQRISISTDDRLVFTADQFEPRIAVIDTQSNEVKTSVVLPDIGYGTAATPDGRYLVVALINLNEVGLIDLATMKLVKTIAVPRSPQAVLVRPDGLVAYVSCDASKQVAAVNLAEWKVDALIDVGSGADGLAWAVGGS